MSTASATSASPTRSVELVAHRLDSGAVPARASQRSHLQVTASLETLQGLRGAPAGQLENGATIPDATVQRLACDATISRVILDATSAVIDVGHSQRVVTGATRRALNARDKGCRWPRCDRPVSWTSAHHIVHWAHGGRTDLDNLALLCHRHHWLVHDCGFQIIRTGDGEILTVRRPTTSGTGPGHPAHTPPEPQTNFPLPSPLSRPQLGPGCPARPWVTLSPTWLRIRAAPILEPRAKSHPHPRHPNLSDPQPANWNVLTTANSRRDANPR